MGQKDLTQKNLESYPDVFADVVNALIYEGKQVVQPHNLQPAPTETIYEGKGQSLRNQFHDVSKYEMQAGRVKLQYTLENETRCNNKMILRKAGYEGAVYREQYDRKMKNTYPVVGLVLHWGSSRWKAPKSLHGFFRKRKLPEEVLRYINDAQLHVFDMRHLSKEVRERFHSDMRIVVDYLAKEDEDSLREQPIRHVEAFLRMMCELTEDWRYEQLIKHVQEWEAKQQEIKEQNTKGGMTMCWLIDECEKRGETLFANLMQCLFRDNRMEDARLAASDEEARKRLYKEYKLC